MVVAAVGSGVVGIKLIDPISSSERVPFAGRIEQLVQCEVLLTDGFVCAVTVDRFSSPDSRNPPLYRSRLQFADRVPDAHSAFLFDVHIEETTHWHETSQARVWSFLSAEAVLDTSLYHDDGNGVRSESSPHRQEQLAFDLQRGFDEIQATSHLADPLWRCVSPELQETGILAVTDESKLGYLHELDGFPLTRLRTALRTVAERDDWTRGDPQTLFPPKATTTLAADQKHNLVQALLVRLLVDLPASP